MSFEEFQHLARLYIVGKLDPEEEEAFQAGRRAFDAEAEAFINECRKLSTVLALSLTPCEPDPRTKERLFARIKEGSVPGMMENLRDCSRRQLEDLILNPLVPGGK